MQARNRRRNGRVPSAVSRCRILLLPGSLRASSISGAVLRTVGDASPPDIATSLYEGLGSLPLFNPDDDTDRPPSAVVQLRQAIRDAGALLLSVPEYAGGLPGAFKNLLDWTIGDDQPGSIYEKPVAWINASSRGAVHAHESLRLVLGYAHADIIESACADIPVTSAMIGADSLIHDRAVRVALVEAVQRLAGK